MNTIHEDAKFSAGRRRFMTGTAGLTFAVSVGVPEWFVAGAAAQSAAKKVTVNPYVTLTTDGTVYIMSPAAEMGQGSLTSLPRIVADEMDADWSKVTIVPAPPDNKLYGNPAFGGLQYTAGSATVRGYFATLRQFGAQVRYVLMDNAARHWNVPLAELTTIPSVVLHEKSGRKLTYGEIAQFAQIPAEAPQIALEPLETKEFRLVGKDIGRIDVPSKVNGSC
ncbi:MAG TPA: molybdopterin cofactor-binding domain-containing protein, partial [Burkholderiales bacterium]|nr:molybdopterin cofactor-binding domain-containing protein [Burkholderiales bacterium]